jgi:hypothetical protein
MCDIWPPHNGIDEDQCVLGCYAMSVGKRSPTFRRSVVPLSSGSSSPGRESWCGTCRTKKWNWWQREWLLITLNGGLLAKVRQYVWSLNYRMKSTGQDFKLPFRTQPLKFSQAIMHLSGNNRRFVNLLCLHRCRPDDVQRDEGRCMCKT